jgi:DUF1707 SHOCT-like domain
MSGDVVPDRRDLRASHQDRDQVVEQLRVAAGDGRLTAEELDERLETALTARTYGELEMVIRDLPTVPGAAPAPPPVAKDLVRLQTDHGNIQRVGPWVVPHRLEVESRSGNVVIDFTQAVITQPTLDLTVSIRSGNLVLIVPPEVAVDVDSIATRNGNVWQRVRREPDAPVKLLVTMSGNVRNGNVVVHDPRRAARGPRRTFWAWLRRRPLPPADPHRLSQARLPPAV